MPIDERWNALSPSDWDEFAAGWIAQLRGETTEADLRKSVVMMNFTSSAEHQWRFITAAMSHARSDEELGHIAAGPMEHLLGKHGSDYIERIEEMATTNAMFGRMMLGVWKHKMTDDVWKRVQAIQAENKPDHDANAT